MSPEAKPTHPNDNSANPEGARAAGKTARAAGSTAGEAGSTRSAGAGAGEALRTQVACLRDVTLDDGSDGQRKIAESLELLIGLLERIEQMLHSQLEVLAKNHAPIRPLAENLKNQALLDIKRTLQTVLGADNKRMNRLANYCDLMMRWWSAVLAGVQTTVMEVPNELTEALNPAAWELEKKRWSAREQAYWDHFRHVIRHELPLKLGDKLKRIQAEKTLAAYSVLGNDQVSEPEQ